MNNKPRSVSRIEREAAEERKENIDQLAADIWADHPSLSLKTKARELGMSEDDIAEAIQQSTKETIMKINDRYGAVTTPDQANEKRKEIEKEQEKSVALMGDLVTNRTTQIELANQISNLNNDDEEESRMSNSPKQRASIQEGMGNIARILNSFPNPLNKMFAKKYTKNNEYEFDFGDDQYESGIDIDEKAESGEISINLLNQRNSGIETLSNMTPEESRGFFAEIKGRLEKMDWKKTGVDMAMVTATAGTAVGSIALLGAMGGGTLATFAAVGMAGASVEIVKKTHDRLFKKPWLYRSDINNLADSVRQLSEYIEVHMKLDNSLNGDKIDKKKYGELIQAEVDYLFGHLLATQQINYGDPIPNKFTGPDGKRYVMQTYVSEYLTAKNEKAFKTGQYDKPKFKMPDMAEGLVVQPAIVPNSTTNLNPKPVTTPESLENRGKEFLKNKSEELLRKIKTEYNKGYEFSEAVFRTLSLYKNEIDIEGVDYGVDLFELISDELDPEFEMDKLSNAYYSNGISSIRKEGIFSNSEVDDLIEAALKVLANLSGQSVLTEASLNPTVPNMTPELTFTPSTQNNFNFKEFQERESYMKNTSLDLLNSIKSDYKKYNFNLTDRVFYILGQHLNTLNYIHTQKYGNGDKGIYDLIKDSINGQINFVDIADNTKRKNQAIYGENERKIFSDAALSVLAELSGQPILTQAGLNNLNTELATVSTVIEQAESQEPVNNSSETNESKSGQESTNQEKRSEYLKTQANNLLIVFETKTNTREMFDYLRSNKEAINEDFNSEEIEGNNLFEEIAAELPNEYSIDDFDLQYPTDETLKKLMKTAQKVLNKLADTDIYKAEQQRVDYMKNDANTMLDFINANRDNGVSLNEYTFNFMGTYMNSFKRDYTTEYSMDEKYIYDLIQDKLDFTISDINISEFRANKNIYNDREINEFGIAALDVLSELSGRKITNETISNVTSASPETPEVEATAIATSEQNSETPELNTEEDSSEPAAPNLLTNIRDISDLKVKLNYGFAITDESGSPTSLLNYVTDTFEARANQTDFDGASFGNIQNAINEILKNEEFMDTHHNLSMTEFFDILESPDRFAALLSTLKNESGSGARFVGRYMTPSIDTPQSRASKEYLDTLKQYLKDDSSPAQAKPATNLQHTQPITSTTESVTIVTPDIIPDPVINEPKVETVIPEPVPANQPTVLGSATILSPSIPNIPTAEVIKGNERIVKAKVNEFRDGIKFGKLVEKDSNGNIIGEKIVSKGFTGTFIMNTDKNNENYGIPNTIVEAIKNGYFAIRSEGSAYGTAIASHTINDNGKEYTILATISKISDERKRRGDVVRYFYTEGSDISPLISHINNLKSNGEPVDFDIDGAYKANGFLPETSEKDYIIESTNLTPDLQKILDQAVAKNTIPLVIPSNMQCSFEQATEMAKVLSEGKSSAVAFKTAYVDRPDSFAVIVPANAGAESTLQLQLNPKNNKV
jgi:hypothetical protein